jgi:hypothetical protein
MWHAAGSRRASASNPCAHPAAAVGNAVTAAASAGSNGSRGSVSALVGAVLVRVTRAHEPGEPRRHRLRTLSQPRCHGGTRRVCVTASRRRRRVPRLLRRPTQRRGGRRRQLTEPRHAQQAVRGRGHSARHGGMRHRPARLQRARRGTKRSVIGGNPEAKIYSKGGPGGRVRQCCRGEGQRRDVSGR